MKATLGRIVLVRGPATGVEDIPAPAIVNRVHGTGELPCEVNLTLFPDHVSPRHLRAVRLFESQTSAAGAQLLGETVAYFPDRA